VSFALGAVVVSGLLAACGSGGAATATSKGPLAVGNFQPYTGGSAALGPDATAGCNAAALGINGAGGVVGHKMTCKAFDSSSDPADSIPAADRMLASTNNLVVVYGPGAGLAAAADPTIENAKVVHFLDDGDPRFNKNASPWLFRFPPSDSTQGIALALYAIQHGYTHPAAVFTPDAGPQTLVAAMNKTYSSRVGHPLATSLTLALNQPSYRTEVAQLLAAHPDAIMTEMAPQTTATFLSELLQLNNGKLPPLIVDGRMTLADEVPVLLHVIGPQRLAHSVIAVIPSTGNTGGPGYPEFQHNLLAAPQQPPNPSQYSSDPYAWWQYDAINLSALAMAEAKSTDPAKWASLITPLADGVPGAVVVHTFAAGKQGLASGHKIHYVGASGALFVNKYHNNFGPYAGYHYVIGKGTGPTAFLPNPGAPITPAQLAAVEQG
jgi:ABC-type branched-subunit amino acid transport system substrate-binding protein